ncbi:hypothetical protein V5N11_033893 [Cardamine amara subsp. amara]|uniref:Zinc finger PHD-type domain-containing protein n=1 Tax=Cardamine amara subsp. amara TaxID=228776 RepID=A0ABD1C2F9_CARAN
MEPPKSDGLCDRFVTGNSDLDYWIWIIEYFAKFKTDLWMLHDVFEMAPKLPDNLGEHINEMVAFRCLASLFDSVSDAKSKIEFDSSHSCEHVLQCILDEIPLSELKPGAPGLSKWNLLPFLQSKLLCLPKCALELMIEPDKDAQVVSPCNDDEAMTSDGKETDQVSPQMADPNLIGMKDDVQSSRRTPEDNNMLLERRNEGFQNESDDHVSSPLEDIYTCVQCKESGKLLFCSGHGCEVMVHQKCLDSPPAYDNAGNFYCSLCSFTCASAEYLQSQDEVAKAKKKLVSFLSLLSQVNKKKSMN